ncbi:hypothetical protein J6590_080299 [Homalodisca vitripennis]|nr:hypothetical protein J6590_080299 [Homalodisca vitripennis]
MGELHYNENIGEGKSLLKRGKKIISINPNLIPKLVQLKRAKLTDLNKLLSKHFMPHWREKEQLLLSKNSFSNNKSCSTHEEKILMKTLILVT